ncbi:hypothetical protein GCM10011344_47060 [Dokdonia pacifica]|uniref:eCIS core domain-containing protein n=1 Tax=Dokdonia pacifica TaxID=1627892 RepID=A0A239DR42_9FLAO|nr:DUF4157 domain-containing protein [Dokdonia pacifica]GGG40809.1 hypothetical protein GCM10011344_47060 [Dokdonia pacifica]SNS34581.1 protein of unknown function [Dokdonia pacifica]
MNTYSDKTQISERQSVANAIVQKKDNSSSGMYLEDNRPETLAQRKLQKATDTYTSQESIQKKENNTGLPDNLKTGIENLSGIAMDDVKVHRNSDKPAQLQAHAYAQGTDIHLGPGQEKHLPHEVWHVVQQKQGLVKPTVQMKGKVNINDDDGLEKEADVMGAKALQLVSISPKTEYSHQGNSTSTVTKTVQRMAVHPEGDYREKLGNQETVINKLDLLIAIMQRALAGVFPEDSMIIEITNKGEMTPAWNHPKGTTNNPGKLGDIGVQFNKWYLERVSLGDLIGMFIHEVGVHTFADKLMGKEVQPNGSWTADGDSNAAAEYHDQSNPHDNQLGGTIEGYPNAAEAPGSRSWRRSRQRDHVNLAKSLSGGKSSRASIYTELYLNTGDAVNEELEEGIAKDTVLKDLTRSFLFDLGRLAATDDGGAVSIFWNTETIGQLMDYYLVNILKPEEDSHKWLKRASLNIRSGKWQIRGYLLGVLGSLMISSNPGSQIARSAVAGTIAGGVMLATGATAAVPAIATAAVVGGGLYLLQKLFGY